MLPLLLDPLYTTYESYGTQGIVSTGEFFNNFNDIWNFSSDFYALSFEYFVRFTTIFQPFTHLNCSKSKLYWEY